MANFAVRLSVFYAALFVWGGMQQPLFPLWLTAHGLEPGTIGLVLALPMLVRIAAIPPAAHAADRHDALRAGLIAAASLAALGFALLGVAEGTRAIALIYAVAALFGGLLHPFSDAFAVKGLGRLRRPIGPVRLWGSATFILGNLVAGLMIDLLAPRHLIWPLATAMALAALAATMLAPLPPDDAPLGAAPASARKLLGNKLFIAIIASASLSQASHALYYGFGAVDWRAAGFDGLTIGTLWGVGIVIEIVLFALQARLPAWIGPTELLLAGGLGGLLRWVGMALDPPFALLPLLQALHALSFGATFLGTVGGIAAVAGPSLAATGQGWFALVAGPAMAGATLVAGWLYQRHGGHAYAAMAVLSATGAALALLVRQWERRE